jgi:hypothetical protein
MPLIKRVVTEEEGTWGEGWSDFVFGRLGFTLPVHFH